MTTNLPDFDPFNWYWVVADSTTQVYSSKASDYVSADDATYKAWLDGGGIATHIASEAELGEVLARFSLRPVPATVLDGYKDTQAREITLKVVAKVLFWLTNEVLALKGQSALSAAQFRAKVKDLM